MAHPMTYTTTIRRKHYQIPVHRQEANFKLQRARVCKHPKHCLPRAGLSPGLAAGHAPRSAARKHGRTQLPHSAVRNSRSALGLTLPLSAEPCRTLPHSARSAARKLCRTLRPHSAVRNSRSALGLAVALCRTLPYLATLCALCRTLPHYAEVQSCTETLPHSVVLCRTQRTDDATVPSQLICHTKQHASQASQCNGPYVDFVQQLQEQTCGSSPEVLR